MIESQFNNVNCILSGANLGYGRANNLGLKNVKTKYALILNPDATLEKSALENFLILVKQNLDFAIIGPMEQEKSESISLIDKLARLSAFFEAPIGPKPITSGAQPSTAVDTILAKISKEILLQFISSGTKS